jgi:hypothetical protein
VYDVITNYTIYVCFSFISLCAVVIELFSLGSVLYISLCEVVIS